MDDNNNEHLSGAMDPIQDADSVETLPTGEVRLSIELLANAALCGETSSSES